MQTDYAEIFSYM